MKTRFQNRDGLVHVCFRDDVGRQEAQHRIVRAVHQQAVLHGPIHNLFAGNGEFHADHQSVAPHFLMKPKRSRKFPQLRAEVIAHAA